MIQIHTLTVSIHTHETAAKKLSGQYGNNTIFKKSLLLIRNYSAFNDFNYRVYPLI